MSETLDLQGHQRAAIDNHLSMLSAVENPGRGFAAFMLAHGRYYTPCELPARMKRGTVKRCFANAQGAVVRAIRAGREPLTYVEGYACSGGLSIALPIHHGWLADANGNVVDPTWEFPARSSYFGVAFSSAYVLGKAERHRSFDSLLDDRRDLWALLNDPAILSEAVEAPPFVEAGFIGRLGF